MSSDQGFIDFIVDQLQNAGRIKFRKMFGEYALYCNGKVFALVCDNQLFVKQTDAGRAFIGVVVEAPAYPGAKMSFLIEDKIDDREWMCELVRITARELPVPKAKKKTVRKTGKGEL
ncbi:MAG: TfoX/Sxy family protein [Candidatus Firestonebacteria bacterium]